MLVSGTIPPEYQGFYARDGLSGGKPAYEKAWPVRIAWAFGSWNIYTGLGGELWWSAEDVATPDLVTTWAAAGGATGLPVVVAAELQPPEPIVPNGGPAAFPAAPGATIPAATPLSPAAPSAAVPAGSPGSPAAPGATVPAATPLSPAAPGATVATGSPGSPAAPGATVPTATPLSPAPPVPMI